MIEQMIQRLMAQQTFETAVVVILNDVVALHGAEFGDLQLIDRNDLVIVAHHGLPASYLKTCRSVGRGDGWAGARALRLGASVVIPDIETDGGYATHRAAAFRAVQSTPLLTRGNIALGVVSTMFANVHEPTPIEMATLKTYSGLAAEYLYKLLVEKNEKLAAKAQAMNRRLYAKLD